MTAAQLRLLLSLTWVFRLPCTAFIVMPMNTPSWSKLRIHTRDCPQHSSRVANCVPLSVPHEFEETKRARIAGTKMKAVRQVTAEELEKEMTEWDLPLILDVFAVWCGPCAMLQPELEKVADTLEGKCRVLKMDSEDESDMASALKVFALPTLLYMKDGLLRHKTEGAVPAQEILQLADQYLFQGEPPADPTDDLFVETT